MIMPFGKYRGKELADIPVSYLRWALDNCERASPALRTEIRRTLRHPDSSGQHSNLLALPSVVSGWYRQLAREFHPDHGGSHEAMKAVNRANELLRQMAGAAT